MSRIQWGQTGKKRYETGVDRGVLFLPNNAGVYNTGVAWNGLTTVTESPSGAESNKQYADNQVYANLKSAEEFGATIEAFTYPDEFEECDGTKSPTPGVSIGQQGRRTFGFSYRTLIGNDVAGNDAGYKVHLVYGCDAAPSEKANGTVNDSPELSAFSWEVTTNPVGVGTINGVEYKPTAHLTVDSTKVSAEALSDLEDILYGTPGADPRMPLPSEVFALFSGTTVEVETTAPTYDAGTDMVTIPATTGVVYSVNGEDVPAGPYGPITEDVVVEARPAEGHTFTATSDTDWTINYS